MSKVDGGGKRYNKGKLPLELVPFSSLEAMAKVLEKGAEKYAPFNWARGMSWQSVYGCAMRHLGKWHSPHHSDMDEETGLNHLYHALCNIAFLIEYEKTCPELDDRFKIDTKSKPLVEEPKTDQTTIIHEFLQDLIGKRVRHISWDTRGVLDVTSIKFEGGLVRLIGTCKDGLPYTSCLYNIESLKRDWRIIK